MFHGYSSLCTKVNNYIKINTKGTDHQKENKWSLYKTYILTCATAIHLQA